jgi:major vault protein
MADAGVIRIKPFSYIHVLDNNSNTTRVEVGPQTFTRADHEKVVGGPEAMVIVPPRHYCIVSNPVERDAKGKVVLDGNKQARLRHGDEEIRFEQDPFPLYPGESLFGKVSPLQVVAPNTALRLKALRDFTDAEGVHHGAGDEWLFKGPGTYTPRIGAQVVEIVSAVVVKPNQALKLRARKATVDHSGTERKAGEEWLERQVGAYLPGVDEEVVETVNAFVLARKALHLRATRTFTDVFNKQRKAGEEWIVTPADAETHIPDVYEAVVGLENMITLTKRQYCYVLDPWKGGKSQLGQKELRVGPTSFFLNPGESLEKGIQDVIILADDEALLLRAKDNFLDTLDGKTERRAGDRWLLKGPSDYVPPVEVEVLEKRTAIPLDENEGIYVRDLQTGKVRAVLGQTVMLSPTEELWKKDLPKQIEDLLSKTGRQDEGGDGKERDKTRVVTYRAPHNCAVQVYDFRERKARVIFGPALVLLGPDEQFTLISLSGDKPKREGVIKSLSLFLGPDFMTDVVIVETSDHARLSLGLSYNWHFQVNKNDPADSVKIFNVPDFVGDACKAIASRVRGAVAGVTFDAFHKNSADIIRKAVFGEKDVLLFTANNLVISNIDIQSVEPVDQRTRDSLQKSVQLAIEITTKSLEATARHDSSRLEQEAMGRLDRQKIEDEAASEKARRELLQLQSDCSAIESTGQATAEAKARAEAAEIEGHASVQQADLAAKAQKIKSETELTQTRQEQELEITHQRQLNELQVHRAKELADIEAEKFAAIVAAIGANTIRAIAQAGPATQAKLLSGLGLKSFLITDGNSPVNLFSTAQGLLGGDPAAVQ